MKWINYHHLIYFREIARQGSISRASEALHVGQPALSAQLKKLEDYLGVNLFERKNRKLILTEPGKIALDYAEKIADLGQELLQVFEQKTFTKRINLSVGAVDAIPKHVVSSMMDFVHKKTGCFLSILDGAPQDLLREILSHNLDVLITDSDVITTKVKNLFSKKIIKSKVCAFASKDFANLKNKFPSSLDGAPAILPTIHSRLHRDLEHYFHAHDIIPDKIAESQDSMLQKILASKGDGVIFLPEIAANTLVREKKLIKLGTLSDVFGEYYLIYTKRIIENPALELLIKQEFKKSDF